MTSTFINTDFFNFTITQQGLQVAAHTNASGGNDVMLLPWLWLRDHCRAEHSFDYSTHQRRQTPIELLPNITADGLEWLDDKQSLQIKWNSEEPMGCYPISFFQMLHTTPQAVGENFIKPILWNASDITAHTIRAEYAQIMEGDSEWLQTLAEYGVVLVTNAPPSLDGVKAIAGAIGHIRETIYGGLWTLESGSKAHEDTAYGYDALGAHTDSTYCHDAPGLQMLLCGELDSKGGESTLVDGFRLAQIMQAEDSDLYDFLCQLAVPGEYLEKNVHLRACRPMFRLDAETNRLVQVSYNCYDRAMFVLSPDESERFYRGVRRFHELAASPAQTFQYKIQPGEALLFDNWRLLHGRQSFSGYRKFYGCYLDRETFQSRLRITLGKTL